MNHKLNIGVSTCLMGENVRHNGGNCNNHYIQNVLAEYAHFVSTCPEVAIGMGIPRPAVRLEQAPNGEALMIDPKSGTDYTKEMVEFSANRAVELEEHDLDGYIFKKNSPSCGVFRVKLYINGQPGVRRYTGLFTQAIQKQFPDIPLEEEGRLCDPVLREHFLVRAFTYKRLKSFLKTDWSRGDLIEFHSREKYLLMAHSPKYYKELGQLVGNIAKYDRDEFKTIYRKLFMTAMNQKATRGRQTNTLQHMAGYLKQDIEEQGRHEVLNAIMDFQSGLVPIIVPITLLKHMLQRAEQSYVLKQSYLDPYPKELMLRNYV